MWHLPWLLKGTVRLQKGAWWHLHHELKRTLGKLLLAVCAIFCCCWRSSWCRVISSRCCCRGSYSFCWLLHPAEPSLTRFRQPTRSQDSWQLLIPGLSTASHRNLHVSLLYLLLCNSDRECPQWGWCGGCSPGKFCMCGTISHEHPQKVMPDLLLLQRSWRDWKGKSRRQLRRQDRWGVSELMHRSSSGGVLSLR